MTVEDLKAGVIVRHFKYETLNDDQRSRGLYTYEIIGISEHTETKEQDVVYKALYEDAEMGIAFGSLHHRPVDMFLSPVDKEKYPNIKQEFRFEPI